MRQRLLSTLTALTLTALSGASAQAAFILIDDTDPNTITITVGDFENGFSVNGTEIQRGLFTTGSITLQDGTLHSILGEWIDLDTITQSAGVSGLFSPNGGRALATSGFDFVGDPFASAGPGFARIRGVFAGYDPAVLYGVGDTLQQGASITFALPFLSGEFRSEPIPEPTSMMLLGAGLLGLAAARRRRPAA